MPLEYKHNYLTGGNSMAAKEVKMCDLPARIAALVFKSLNYGKLELYIDGYGNRYIITDVEPKHLTYPEGWYYAKGAFRNKHNSTTGVYEEICMRKTNGDFWSRCAKYCTRN